MPIIETDARRDQLAESEGTRVLRAQSRALARAREVMSNIAKGRLEPRHAAARGRISAMMGGSDNRQILADVYQRLVRRSGQAGDHPELHGLGRPHAL